MLLVHCEEQDWGMILGGINVVFLVARVAGVIARGTSGDAMTGTWTSSSEQVHLVI